MSTPISRLPCAASSDLGSPQLYSAVHIPVSCWPMTSRAPCNSFWGQKSRSSRSEPLELESGGENPIKVREGPPSLPLSTLTEASLRQVKMGCTLPSLKRGKGWRTEAGSSSVFADSEYHSGSPPALTRCGLRGLSPGCRRKAPQPLHPGRPCQVVHVICIK